MFSLMDFSQLHQKTMDRSLFVSVLFNCPQPQFANQRFQVKLPWVTLNSISVIQLVWCCVLTIPLRLTLLFERIHHNNRFTWQSTMSYVDMPTKWVIFDHTHPWFFLFFSEAGSLDLHLIRLQRPLQCFVLRLESHSIKIMTQIGNISPTSYYRLRRNWIRHAWSCKFSWENTFFHLNL